jgi:hypothetical protein
MNKLYSGRIGFHIIAADQTVRTFQDPTVLHRKAILKLMFEGDAFVAVVPMLAATEVLPAILDTFEYETIRILPQ